MEISINPRIIEQSAPVHSGRQLGQIETAMHFMNKELHGSSQSAAIYHITGEIKYPYLYQAAKLLFDQYAILRCRIIEVEGKFELVEDIPFSRIPIKHITLSSSDNWKVFFEDEVDLPLMQSGELWRISLYSCPEIGKQKIVVIGHHSIMDSVGSRVFINQLLTNLDNIISGEMIETISHDIPPPIEYYLKPLRHVIDTPLPRAQIKVKQPARLEARRTRWIDEKISKNQLRKLNEKCVQENIKINSLLSAAFCIEAYNMGMVESPVPVRSAVSLRFGKIPRGGEQELACYITLADTPIEVTQEDNIKTVALTFEKELFRYIIKKCPYSTAIDMKALSDLSQHLKDTDIFLHGLGISNIGEAEITSLYKNFKIDYYDYVINRMSGSFAVALQIMIQHDEMRFAFVYTEPLMDEETVGTLSRAFIEMLINF